MYFSLLESHAQVQSILSCHEALLGSHLSGKAVISLFPQYGPDLRHALPFPLGCHLYSGAFLHVCATACSKCD